MFRHPNSRRAAAELARPPQKSQRSGFTLVEIIATVTVVCVVIAIVISTVQAGPESARRKICLANMQQVAQGLQNYLADHGEFPPAYTTDAAGKPLHSWRTLILPYMEPLEKHQALYKAIDLTKPWNDPANAKALAAMPEVYRCCSPPDRANRTTYLAVLTPASCIEPAKPRKLADVTDRPIDTLVIIEVDADRAVPWMAPTDADESVVLSLSKWPTNMSHAQVILAAFADGSARWISDNQRARYYRALISIAGNDTGDAEEED